MADALAVNFRARLYFWTLFLWARLRLRTNNWLLTNLAIAWFRDRAYNLWRTLNLWTNSFFALRAWSRFFALRAWGRFFAGFRQMTDLAFALFLFRASDDWTFHLRTVSTILFSATYLK